MCCCSISSSVGRLAHSATESVVFDQFSVTGAKTGDRMNKRKQKRNSRLLMPLFVVGLLCLTAAFTLRNMVRSGNLNAFPCSDTIITTADDPSKTYRAVLLERACGATTDFARHIYVTEGTAEGGYKESNPIMVAEGQGINRISWRDSSTLEVHYTKSQTKFFIQPKSCQHISVVYIGNE